VSLTYQRGDLMKVKRSADEVVVVTTNGTIKKDGACVMGRGIARQVRDSIPGIDKRLGS
jgi:formylmethanofuran dehydrogenase subunit D